MGKPVTIVMDSQEYLFIGGINFTDFQEELAEIVISTAERAREKLAEAISLYRGVVALQQQVQPATYFALPPQVARLVSGNMSVAIAEDVATALSDVVA
jgi:hypothetical protein